jgi:hypothetical protein
MQPFALAIRPGTLRQKTAWDAPPAISAHGAHHQIVSALRGARHLKIHGKWPATQDVVA